MKVTERVYVNADGSKVVPENSPHAARLLAAAGDEIDDRVAQRLGLLKSKEVGKAAPPEGDKALKPGLHVNKVRERGRGK